jgi:hypothetical protein
VTARHRAPGPTRPRRTAAAGSGLLALLLLGASLLFGQPALAQTTGSQEQPTLLRFAELTPDLPDAELSVSSVMDPRKNTFTATLHYGDVSPYQAVAPGDYVVTMRPAGSSEPPVVSRTLTVQRGTAYTVAAVRHEKTPDDLGVITDDLARPASDRARVRVINAAPPAAQLDVRAGTEPLATALPIGQASPYRDVAPGEVTLTVGPPGGQGVDLPVSVAANQVASVVLTSGDDGGVPKAAVVVDANGPSQVPPGPVHAGFGGTAGPAPGAAAGSAVLAALAAVAAGVSVRLARR